MSSADPKLDTLRVLLRELEAGGCAIYRWRKFGPEKQIQILCTYAPFMKDQERGLGVAKSILRVVYEALQAENDSIFPPPPLFQRDSRGRIWWHLIIATGAVLKHGYVISVVLPACNREEVLGMRDRIQAVFEPSVTEGGTESEDGA